MSIALEELKAPKFHALPLAITIALKPIADALYFIGAVKYIYFALLAASALFYIVSSALYPNQTRVYSARRLSSGYFILLLLYFVFLLSHSVHEGTGAEEALKIISPFVAFALLYPATSAQLKRALVATAWLTIILATLLLPTEYGWRNWGGVSTFRGFYYFKTDLAYAITFALLLVLHQTDSKLSAQMIFLILLCGTMVILANSRLNYLSFAIVLIYIAAKNGVNIRSAARATIASASIAIAFYYLFDAERMLGFDIRDTNAFSQGRLPIWYRVLDAQLSSTSLEWFLGRGLLADRVLSATSHAEGTGGRNAHNEYLQLLFNQGVVGTLAYMTMWAATWRQSFSENFRFATTSIALPALLIFMLQGMTGLVSVFASKTLALVWVFLVVRADLLARQENHAHLQNSP